VLHLRNRALSLPLIVTAKTLTWSGSRTEEREMRKTLVAAAVAAIVSAGSFLAGGANAMTMAAPAGLKAAAEGVTTAEQVRYVCYRVRRHGGWRRVCSWRPNHAYGYGYGYRPSYGYGYGYGYSPYYYRPYGYYGWRRPGVGFSYRF
jgi:hypothetical protein